MNTWRPLSIENVTVLGDLRARMIKNFARLHDWWYLPNIVGNPPAMSEGWPGDWEGRTVLALTLMEEALRTESAYADSIVQSIRDRFNQAGYRGETLDFSCINEQLFPSHNWLMRAWIERYRITGDKSLLDDVETILNNLFIPIIPHLPHYPGKNERPRFVKGEAAGKSDRQYNEWLLSSDIGCLFISLDALAQIYIELHEERLRPLLDTMLSIFMETDFSGSRLQTHASLTGMRGAMRMYTYTGDVTLLEKIELFFDEYVTYGMTENYANFDWFMTPSWSEPCGIIDSYMLAEQLWQATGNIKYLHYAHEIWYNGVLRGQRENGGFGCDTCAENGIIRTSDFYEAYWCCTMRGGEGLGYPARHAAYMDGDRILIPQYLNADLRVFGALIKERTEYPEIGSVTFTISRGDDRNVRWQLYVPQWAVNVRLTVNGDSLPFKMVDGFLTFDVLMRSGTAIALTFEIPVFTRPTVGKIHEGEGYSTIRYGVLVLGADKSVQKAVPLQQLRRAGPGIYQWGDINFVPLHQSYLMTRDEIIQKHYQILFHIESEKNL